MGRFLPAFLAPLALGRIERTNLRPASLYGAQAALYAGLVAIVSAGVPLTAILSLALLDGVLSLNARALIKTAIVATTGRPASCARARLLALAFTLSRRSDRCSAA